MNGADHSPHALNDALLAARLLAVAPRQLRGIQLRGGGPARDTVLDQLRANFPQDAPWRRLPSTIDDERLLGGIDLAASLAEGRPVLQSGLLAEASGGVLVAPMAERMREGLAGKLAQAMDIRDEGRFALALLDDGREPEEQPPANVLDRIAFHCDLSRVESLDHDLPWDRRSVAFEAVAEAGDDDMSALAQTAAALGIETVRPLLFASSTARAHAALSGRTAIEAADLQAAARLVLAPRATQIPQLHESEEPAPTPEPEEPSASNEDSIEQLPDQPLEDLILEAAIAAIPADVLEQIAEGRLQRSAPGGGSGQRTRSALRGKPLGARPGIPRGGARMALVDTLRAAVPWQEIRRREEPATKRAILVRKDDLRIRRFEERMATVTVFCVDASGSAAMARLAEAKGAVELILAQAYVKRSEVALIAFRGESAEVLLPPTRSLTRARRALAQLPGGGGTPLASGVQAGQQMAEAISARGRTPFLVFLTDGSANIAANGTPGRAQAREDAKEAARRVAAAHIDALVIDISPRPRADAEQLAATMRARYLPLPMADAAALERAVSAAQPAPAPA